MHLKIGSYYAIQCLLFDFGCQVLQFLINEQQGYHIVCMMNIFDSYFENQRHCLP